jgi:purine-binding chemotaxis protein CheW
MNDSKTRVLNWDDQETDTYLVFSIAGGLYATPLLDVREVVEFKSPKPLSNTKPSFLGVINIRGEIVGIVDLAMCLGGKATKAERPTLLVVGKDDAALAALVDEVLSVVKFEDSSIDRHAHGQQSDCISSGHLGIARLEERLVTLLDLGVVVGAQNISNLQKITA